MKAGPPQLGLDVTNRCNLNCIMCARQAMTRPVGDMDFGLFKRIIDEGRRFLEFAWLQDYGEPLLHKDISRMIAYCREKGIPCGISTNAMLLTKEAAEEILAAGLDYIIFAFDGSTRQTYEGIRKGADYEKVLANIRGFLDIKLRKKYRTFVTVQCIYMRETEPQIRDFIKMWKLPGVNALRLRQLTYSYERYGSQHNKFRNPGLNLPCYWLWRNPHIKWDGVVVPCCQDVNAFYNAGNIKDSSLIEIWNGKLMQDLRRAHLGGMRSKLALCRECNMYQPAFILAAGSFLISASAVNRLVPATETIMSSLRYGGAK